MHTCQVIVYGFFFIIFFYCLGEDFTGKRKVAPFQWQQGSQDAVIAVIIFAILTTNRLFSEDELKIIPWICDSSFTVLWQQSISGAGSLTAQILWTTNLPLGKSLLNGISRLVQYYSLYYTVHLHHQISKPTFRCLKNLHDMKLVRWEIWCHFLWDTQKCCSQGCREKFRAWFNTAFK